MDRPDIELNQHVAPASGPEDHHEDFRPQRSSLTARPLTAEGSARTGQDAFSGLGTLLATIPVLLALAACSDPPESACPGGCPAGFVCETRTKTCQPRRLPAWQEPIPGRAASAVSVGEQIWLASLDTASGSVLVGRTGSDSNNDNDSPTMRVLDDTASGSGGLAMAGSPAGRGPLLAWLTPSSRYRMAIRRDDRWVIDEPVDVADFDYLGTPDFDVELGAEETVHLVFRNGRGGGLYHLSRPEPTADWRVELVDDGHRDSLSHGCRQSAPGPDSGGAGVGHTPDLARIGGDLFTAYHDADCGDLRLARRPDETRERWAISVIDTGDFSPAPDAPLRTGDVGRHPSLAETPQGGVAVAYQDRARGRLMYAAETSGRFDIQLVDPGVELDELSQKRKLLVGAFASLSFDDDGRPRIAYLNSSRTRLRLAHRARDAEGQPRWIHQTLAPSAPVGFSAGLVRDTDGRDIIVAERFATGSDANSDANSENSAPASRLVVIRGAAP